MRAWAWFLCVVIKLRKCNVCNWVTATSVLAYRLKALYETHSPSLHFIIVISRFNASIWNITQWIVLVKRLMMMMLSLFPLDRHNLNCRNTWFATGQLSFPHIRVRIANQFWFAVKFIAMCTRIGGSCKCSFVIDKERSIAVFNFRWTFAIGVMLAICNPCNSKIKRKLLLKSVWKKMSLYTQLGLRDIFY